ncbi:SGNH/GDSL hydrolase family protein [Actinomadura roseirufa]|uniref:SGNH/GDSL hydrolase family protein n=1 Tax=Actinomadura roseirufa TaxID=2094049 RepID=UPI0010412239|nr:GDSL-type esterase/lipase family protein [Actinomadura roseirufa]
MSGTNPGTESQTADRTALTERLVRFQQPGKSLFYLGRVEETRVAELFGLDLDAYRAMLAGFEDQVREVAGELLARPGFGELVDRLPFEADQHIVAIGESTTADRLSWFEILRHLLALRRPAESIRLTNLAVSGSSTTQALTLLPGLAFQRPDQVLCMLGANDVQRLGPGGPSLVSLSETERNLRALRDLAGRRGPLRWTWLTPSAVDEARVAEYTHFQRAGLSWANEDIDAVAEFLLREPEPTVDTRSLPHSGDDPHLPDGVHLTLEGQRDVAVAVVQALAGA